MEAWLTSKEVAQILSLSPGTLANWRLIGRGPAFSMFGRAVRYKQADVEAWTATQPQGAQNPSLAASPPSTLQPPPNKTTTTHTHQLEILTTEIESWKNKEKVLQGRFMEVSTQQEQYRLKSLRLERKVEGLKRNLSTLKTKQEQEHSVLRTRLQELEGFQLATKAKRNKGKPKTWLISIGDLNADPDGEPFFHDQSQKQWWPASSIDEFDDYIDS